MTNTNTQQKAPGACDSKGLHTDTNTSNFASHGPLDQPPDPKAMATQIANLAVAGHVVYKGTAGDYMVSKYGYTRHCENFAELVAFAVKVGAP